MANKDILVGHTIKPTGEPEEITESFDGENENINYSKLTDAAKNLKKDLKSHYQKMSKELKVIEFESKPFT